MYADDLAVTAQASTFEAVEGKLSNTLKMLTEYYIQNQLRPNPSKTQVCAFHLRNKEANRTLKVSWLGEILGHTEHPVYLGVTMDRTLSFKNHCTKTKMKVQARNNLLRRLTGTTWGARPHTVRTTAMALCLPAAEYACEAWGRSSHVKQVDTAVNDTCRIITGCLRPTPRENLFILAGIAPPQVRRVVAADVERTKQIGDARHVLFEYTASTRRLKSRNSFMAATEELTMSPEDKRLILWNAMLHNNVMGLPGEELPPGKNLTWPIWKTLNRLRTGVGRTRANMNMWGYSDESIECDCGEIQNGPHLLCCPLAPVSCTFEDLMVMNSDAKDLAVYWHSKGI